MPSNKLNPFSNSGNEPPRKSSMFGSITSIKNKIGRSKSDAARQERQNTLPTNNNSFPDTPPPAYTSTAPTTQNTSRQYVSTPNPTPTQPVSSKGKAVDDSSPFAFLRTFDTILLIDDSLSMAADYPSRWDQTGKILQDIAGICTGYDRDGIDVFFLNYKSNDKGDASKGLPSGGWRNVKSENMVMEIFSLVQPNGGTPTAQRLAEILRPYMRRLEKNMSPKPLNVIVITDGQADNNPEDEIIHIARRLDKADAPFSQLGIQFFQVGNDPGAKEALQELDDKLAAKADVRDIVDTVTWQGRDAGAGLTADGILKTVLGAVNKRLDMRPASGDHQRT